MDRGEDKSYYGSGERREIERIRNVYRIYDTVDKHRAKRSPENRGNVEINRERLRETISVLRQSGRIPTQSDKVLDVGCAHGRTLASFVQMGADSKNLFGVDLLPDRIDVARKAYPRINFILGDGTQLAFGNQRFDLIVSGTLFSSILDDVIAVKVACEMKRVLKTTGAIFWYDFRYNNPWNRHVRGISQRRIRQFFPEFTLDVRTVTLLPFVARRLGWATGLLYSWLSEIEFLRTHYIGLLCPMTRGANDLRVLS
jgi:ubiquinone/menaquinone biosynthesis C-methylase UbiE